MSVTVSWSSLPLDLVCDILVFYLTPMNLIIMRALRASWILYKLFAGRTFTYYTHMLYYDDSKLKILEAEHTPFSMVIRYAFIGCQKITFIRHIYCHHIHCVYEINIKDMTHEQVMRYMHLFIDNVSSAGVTYYRGKPEWPARHRRLRARARAVRAKMMDIERYLFDHNVAVTVNHSKNRVMMDAWEYHKKRNTLVHLRHNPYTDTSLRRNAFFWHWGLSQLLMIACGDCDEGDEGNTAEFFTMCC